MRYPSLYTNSRHSVFSSTSGEPKIINSLEYDAAERSQLGLKNSVIHGNLFHPESYFESNIPLSLIMRHLCEELHEASSDYQNTLHRSLFSGNFSSLQRHETNLAKWYARLPAEFQAECRCTIIDESLLLEQKLNLHLRYCLMLRNYPLLTVLMFARHRYHYTQILLYRPAISSLLKLQARPGSVEVPGDHPLQGSFALSGLKQFAWKCLEAAVRAVDLLRTFHESGREIMNPERNFNPFCFCAYSICLVVCLLLIVGADLSNTMLVMIAARCCADDGFYEIDLHAKWHQAFNILQSYQRASRTTDVPFRFFDAINQRLFRESNEGNHALEPFYPWL